MKLEKAKVQVKEDNMSRKTHKLYVIGNVQPRKVFIKAALVWFEH